MVRKVAFVVLLALQLSVAASFASAGGPIPICPTCYLR